MSKNLIYLANIISILISLRLNSQETSCNHVEKETISEGAICWNDILYFTSNVETIVAGEVSANKVIVITPKPNVSITFKAINPNCNNCVEPSDGNGTTIKSRGSGGGKTNNKSSSTSEGESKKHFVKIKKNPAKDVLELYIPKNTTIAEYSIYDSFGKKIASSNYPTPNKDEIKISHLPTGYYRIILTTTENKTITLNFIKN